MENRALPALAWVAVAVVIAVVVYDVTRRASSMRASIASVAAPQQAPLAQPGGDVKRVVRLERTERQGHYLAATLASVTETTYRDTGTRFEVELTPQTQFVMGSAADVKPGAVVELAGTFDAARVVQARRIVILTGYIQVTTG
jgi:hypothetical protein